MKYFIIGSGIWGTVIAERIASEMNEQVMVVDKRDHIGGNCHSSLDEETGIECHRYGSHIFHTSLPEVWEYLSLFGEFTSYRHKVLITHGGKVYACLSICSRSMLFMEKIFLLLRQKLSCRRDCAGSYRTSRQSGRESHFSHRTSFVRSIH